MAFLVSEHYDPSYYDMQVDRYLRRTRFTRHRLANVFGLLGDVSGKRVLDLGCGMGACTVESALRGARVVGVDPAPAGLKAARGLAERLGARNVELIAADASDLPVPDSSVDAVICADLTEHLDEATLAGVLREAARTLRPGGVLALYTPSRTHLFERLKASGHFIEDDPSHIGLRAMSQLVAAVEDAGLDVARAFHRPTHIPVFNTVEQILAPVPGVGGLFRRRVCIAARKPAGKPSAEPAGSARTGGRHGR